MNKILIGSDEGTYTPNDGLQTITLSELTFTPIIEQLAYVYNKTQDELYYAPAEGIAQCTLAGLVITVDAGFAALAAADEIHIQMWRPPKADDLGQGNLSSAAGDFTATIVDSSKTITIADLDVTLTALHVVGGNSIKKVTAAGVVSDVALTSVSVAAGVITLADESVNFVTGDTVVVQLLAPVADSDYNGRGNYSNAKGDFTAVITNATKNITVTQLDFTLEAKHVIGGNSIKKTTSAGVVTNVALTSVAVAGGVITLANEGSNFATGDTVVVDLQGPDKAYDESADADRSFVTNPEYDHNTSVETLISESNLGIDGTHDGTAAQQTVFTDTGETFTPATVAEGYEIYNVTDGTNATITVGAGAGTPTADDITSASVGSNWDTDQASIPEVKRFVIPVEGYKQLKLHYKVTAGAANQGFLKVYDTLNSDADDTDDTDWVDVSIEHLTGKNGFDTSQIKTTASSEDEDVVLIDCSASLKLMVKIVAECTDGVQSNAFEVFVKKS